MLSTGQRWVLGALVCSAFLTGGTATSLPTEAFAGRSGDRFPLVFQAPLQKRSTSVITTWLSKPGRGREDGEDFHALRHGPPAGPAASCCPRPLREPGVRCAVSCGVGLQPGPAPPRSCRAHGTEERSPALRGLTGAVLSFYVLPDCEFLNFLYSL